MDAVISFYSDLQGEKGGEGGHGLDVLYAGFYAVNEERLGPYLRTLYHLFKLIDTSGLEKEERIRYANIARATLARSDTALLAANCATKYGLEFRALIESYGLLKHLSPSLPTPQPPGARSMTQMVEQIIRSRFAPTATMSSDARDDFWGKYPSARPRTM